MTRDEVLDQAERLVCAAENEYRNEFPGSPGIEQSVRSLTGLLMLMQIPVTGSCAGHIYEEVCDPPIATLTVDAAGVIGVGWNSTQIYRLSYPYVIIAISRDGKAHDATEQHLLRRDASHVRQYLSRILRRFYENGKNDHRRPVAPDQRLVIRGGADDYSVTDAGISVVLSLEPAGRVENRFLPIELLRPHAREILDRMQAEMELLADFIANNFNDLSRSH